MNDHDVTVERAIHAPAERVWATLTDPALVSAWMMGAIVSSTWKQGAPITWKGEYQGQEYIDQGHVVAVEENKRLVHTHVSGMSGAEGSHRLDWTLTQAGDTTTLTLVQSGARSREQADQFKQTWETMLDVLRDVAQE